MRSCARMSAGALLRAGAAAAMLLAATGCSGGDSQDSGNVILEQDSGADGAEGSVTDGTPEAWAADGDASVEGSAGGGGGQCGGGQGRFGGSVG